MTDEIEVNCPKCRGTEYGRYRIAPSFAYPEGWYYHCEDCNYTSEPS